MLDFGSQVEETRGRGGIVRRVTVSTKCRESLLQVGVWLVVTTETILRKNRNEGKS